MKKLWEKLKLNKKGVSMVSLVITIIVILILSAIVFVTSIDTIGRADYSKYVTNVSDVSSAFYETSTNVNGTQTSINKPKEMDQVYNYVAKDGYMEKDFLPRSDVPTYTVIKDQGQIGIDLPEMKVESGTGKRVPVKYATTKGGQVFTWPPYDYDGKLYITDTDTVEDKMNPEITVGGETFEILINSGDGTLMDLPGLPEIPEEPGPEHSYTAQVQSPEYLVSEANCTSPAVYYYKCNHCDERGTETYTVGGALGHNFGAYETTRNPNCTEVGIKTRTCARCGLTDIEEIPMDKTKHEESSMPQVENPTCTEEGSKKYTCYRCNVELRAETIPAKGHSFGTWTTDKTPTCAEEGLKTRKCTACTEKETENIPVDTSRHYGNEVGTVTTPATCTSAGTKTYKCDECNKVTRTEEISKTSHNYGSFETTKEPTCTTTGTKQKTCSVCNNTITEEIPVKEHDYTRVVTPPTIESEGYTTYTCKNCSDSYVDDRTEKISLEINKTKLGEFINANTPKNIVFTTVGATAGTDVSEKQNGYILAWMEGETCYVSVKEAGNKIGLPADSSEFFSGNKNAGYQTVESIDLRALDVSKVTTMKDMFNGSDKLSQVTLGENFKFVGTNGYLPTQNEANVIDADGKWYDIATGENYTAASIPQNKEATYTAINNKYNIVYNLAGGNFETEAQAIYRKYSLPVTLETPVKEGYTFTGWTGDNGSNSQTSVTIEKGTTGDKSYTANWSANNVTYNVEYKSTSGISLGTTTVEKAFGTTNEITAPEKEGYNTPATQTIAWDTTTAKTITFEYEPIEYNVELALNGGTLESLASQAKIGDYVTYEAASGVKEWRVFDIVDNKVMIIPVGTNPGFVSLRGAQGYFRGLSEIEGYSDNNTNNKLGITASDIRSMTIEDLNNATGYTLATETRYAYYVYGDPTYTSGTEIHNGIEYTKIKPMLSDPQKYYEWDDANPENITKDSSGYSYAFPTEGKPVYVTQIYYRYNPSSYTHVRNSEVTVGELLGTSQTWLASKATEIYPDFARFGIHTVKANSVDSESLIISDRNDSSSIGYTTRPIVFLGENIKGTRANETAAWELTLNNATETVNIPYTIETETFELGTPVKTGYTFTGWTGDNGSNPQTSVTIEKGTTGDKEYTANWSVNKVTYNVEYKSTSGISLGKATVEKAYGTTNVVTAPEITGYNTPASQTIAWDTLTAKTITFTYEPTSYSITIDCNGGSGVTSTSYTIETPTFTLGTPEREGYTFSGWTGANGANPETTIIIEKGSTGARTYVANWSGNSVTYNIEYKSTSGLDLGSAIMTKNMGTTNEIVALEIAGYETPASQTVAWDSQTPKTITFTYEPIEYNVELTLNGGKLDSIVSKAQVGDYVNYETYAPATWRVFDIVDGKVLITPVWGIGAEGDVSVEPRGADGYVNAVNKIEEKCDKFVNVELGITADDIRSMTLEDLYNAAGYTPVESTEKYAYFLRTDSTYDSTELEHSGYTKAKLTGPFCKTDDTIPRFYTWDYAENVSGDENGYLYAFPTEGKPVYVTNTARKVYPTSYPHVKNSSITVGDVIGKGGWIANPCVDASSSSAIFALPSVGMDYSTEYYVLHACGEVVSRFSFVRPLVALGDDIQATRADENSPWELSVNNTSENVVNVPYTIETETFTIGSAAREGYTFTGWTGENFVTGENSITIEKGTTGNKEYEANWEAITYNVTIDCNGGTGVIDRTYTIEDETFTLDTPSREGYTFIGWTGSNGEAPQTSVSITKGSIGDKHYKANWKGNSYTYNIVCKSTTGKDLGTSTITNVLDASTLVNAPEIEGYTAPEAQYVSWNSMTPKTITFVYEPTEYNIELSLNGGSYDSILTKVKIGDSVNYSANGATKWKVFDIKDGKVIITPERGNGISGQEAVKLEGVDGYVNAINKLEEMCDNYTNSQLNVTADDIRAMTVEDLYEIAEGYTPTESTTKYAYFLKNDSTYSSTELEYSGYTKAKLNNSNCNISEEPPRFYTWDYAENISGDENGYLYAYPTEGKPVYVTDTINLKIPRTYQHIRNNSITVGDVLGTGLAWLATPCVSASRDMAVFSMPVVSSTYSTSYYLVHACGKTLSKTMGALPLVTLGSNIKATRASETAAWDLSIMDDSVSEIINVPYTIETETFTLEIPIRPGYDFTGWTGDNGDTAQTSVSIAKGTTGNKSYTANWNITEYNVELTLNGGSLDSIVSKAQVGDYVNYETFMSEKWRVFDIVDGKVLITPVWRNGADGDVAVTLSGVDGYVNAVNKLEDKCDEFTNNELGITADDIRSMTLEDLYNATGYKPVESTEKYAYFLRTDSTYDSTELEHSGYTKAKLTGPYCTFDDSIPRFYTWDYAENISGDENGYLYAFPTEGKPVYVTNTARRVIPVTYEHVKNDSVTIGDLIGTGGWLATTGVSATDQYAVFSVLSAGNVIDMAWYTQHACGTVVSKFLFARPLVALGDNIQATRIDENSPWELSVNNTSENIVKIPYTMETETFTIGVAARDGYTFTGWTGENLATPENTITIEKGSIGDKEYEANWETITYNVTIDCNGGTGVTDGTYTTETESFTLDTPSREGYTFIGWTGSNGKVPQTSVSIVKGSIGDKQYKANWKGNSYTYNIVCKSTTGKDLGTSTITNVLDASTLVNAPEIEGYTSPEAQYVSWNSMTPKTITFIYEPTEYNIELSLNGGSYDSILTKVKIGDSVNYSANGASKWKVFDIKDGKVIITPTPGNGVDGREYITLTGADGFANAVDIIEAKCDEYTNSALNITADDIRAMTLEDLYEIAGYTPAESTEKYAYFLRNDSTYNTAVLEHTGYTKATISNYNCNISDEPPRFYLWDYAENISGDENGNLYAYPTEGKPVYVTKTSNVNIPLTYEHIRNSSVKVGDLLGTGLAWLANPLVSATSNSAIFSMPVTSGTYDTTYYIVHACGKSLSRGYSARPLITLGSNIKATRASETAAWDLSIMDDSVSEIVNVPYTIETETFTLEIPTRPGYEFTGWTGDNGDTEQTEVIIEKGTTGNKEYEANWNEISYSITINCNGGTGVTSTSYTIKTETFTLGTPVREGYTFTGWTDVNGTTYESVTIEKGSTGARNYTANWTANNYTYNVVYKSTTGIDLGTTTVEKTFGTTNIIAPQEITGYDTPASQEIAWDSSDAKVITFNYQPTSYSITINCNGGSGVISTSYTIETPTFTLETPVREGYTFTGWTDVNGIVHESVTIEKGSIGARNYTANWELATANYTVNHWQQKVSGGTTQNSTNFTKYATESLSGNIGSSVTPARKSYTGFTSPSGKSVTISADGSSVVDYYYTRKSYTFTLGSNTGVSTTGSSASGSYKYGATITLKATVNDGYEWSKWVSSSTSLVANKTATSTTFSMPAGNITMTPTVTKIIPPAAYAVYSGTDGSLTFYKTTDTITEGGTYNGKTATKVYTGIETTNYTSPPWYYHPIKKVVFYDNIVPISVTKWFNNLTQLTKIENIGKLDTSNVTSMQGMFLNCRTLKSVDLSGFNTSKVTNMSAMFDNCYALTDMGDLSGWDTSKVTDISYMFNMCESLVTINVSGFNTGNVTDMTRVFSGCRKVTSLNLSKWDTSKVTSMEYMFGFCNALTTLNISGFKTSKVTTMQSMFTSCSSLTTLNLSSFDTSLVNDMQNMFASCSSLTTLNIGNGFKTSNVTTMNQMFYGCSKLSFDCSTWDVSKVESSTHFNTNASGVIEPSW